MTADEKARAVRRALLARRKSRVRARRLARRAGLDLFAEWRELGEPVG